ncbi:MAG: choice-of-anchor Q domain-containing protein, partial [Rhodanobacteraceae bacterium]
VSHCSLFSAGRFVAYGGAIYSHGRTYLSDTRITDSTAQAPDYYGGGGAIFASSVRIIRSTLSGNTAISGANKYSFGGGILTQGGAEIRYSTIADNTADLGGGLMLTQSTTPQTRLIINSTISGNHAGHDAGGLYCGSAPSLLRISNSTITANSAAVLVGAGARTFSAVEIVSSIIAGNAQTLGTVDIAAAESLTGSNNIIIQSNVPLPPDTIQADPQLGPLQDNGGATLTHAVLAGSPAIDQGLNALGLLLDQRAFDIHVPDGYEREVGQGTDIGAFEFGAPDGIFADGFEA